jgi:hypothetical protein
MRAAYNNPERAVDYLMTVCDFLAIFFDRTFPLMSDDQGIPADLPPPPRPRAAGPAPVRSLLPHRFRRTPMAHVVPFSRLPDLAPARVPALGLLPLVAPLVVSR